MGFRLRHGDGFADEGWELVHRYALGRHSYGTPMCAPDYTAGSGCHCHRGQELTMVWDENQVTCPDCRVLARAELKAIFG